MSLRPPQTRVPGFWRETISQVPSKGKHSRKDRRNRPKQSSVQIKQDQLDVRGQHVSSSAIQHISTQCVPVLHHVRERHYKLAARERKLRLVDEDKNSIRSKSKIGDSKWRSQKCTDIAEDIVHFKYACPFKEIETAAVLMILNRCLLLSGQG